MTINENYFYFNFKKTKSICNLLNIENNFNNLDIIEDNIIELLKEDEELLLNLCLKNKNIVFKIINIYCFNSDKIDDNIMINFMNYILSNIEFDKIELEILILSIYQNSFFSNKNAEYLLNNFFYKDSNSFVNIKNSYILDNILNEIEILSFSEIIQKYNIIKNTSIYLFINFYKNILESNDNFKEEFFENNFNDIIKPYLIYIINNQHIIKKIIEFFSISKEYKNYISKILYIIITKNSSKDFFYNIKNYKIKEDCLTFIINYLNGKGINFLFKHDSARTRFWNKYFAFIEDIVEYKFKNKLCYIIYFKDIVIVEFDPVGSIYFYKKEDFSKILTNPIKYEEQLRNERLYIYKINHISGWQYDVINILKSFNISLK